MKIKLLVLFLSLCLPFLATAQFLETFESATTGSSSFSSNGQTFNFSTVQGSSTFQVQSAFPGTGWSGTAVDNRYFDNNGTANTTVPLEFQISSTTAFRVNSFWIYLADISNDLNVTGTLTIKGSYNGNEQFTATSTAGFNNKNLASNNGFTLIDLSTFGGANNAVKNIDAITITTTGSFNYIALDALTWSGPLAPVFTASPANVAICPGLNTSFSVTTTNTYGYQWQVDTGSGFTNVSNGGVYNGATTATLEITGATAGMNTYQYRCVASGVSSFQPINSNAATLTINPTPSIATQPVNTSVNVGGNTTITAQTSGATGYQWQIDTGSGFSNLTNSAPYSGVTTTTLTITNATLGMNGYVYRLVATGSCAPAVNSNSATLTVTNGVISSSGSLGNFSTVFGTSSSSQQFNISGTNLTAGILVTPPTGFEVSTNNTTFQPTVTVGAAGNVASTPVYVRLRSTIATGTYSGDIQLTSTGASTVNVATAFNGPNAISAAPLTITVNNQSKAYGAALPSLTASYSGFVNGDTQASLTTQPTLSTLATAASTVAGSPYAITASGAASSNYNISYVAGTLTVTPASLTITANNQAKAYGAALPSLTASYSGFVNGDTEASLTTQPTLSTLATAASTVAGSPYAITASGAASSNYTINYVAGTLAVTAAPLTITANNQTKAYGAALPSLTASYSGFVNGDTQASLTTQPTLSTLATAASTVAGSPYAITASGAASSNYTINYVAGSLAVTAAPLTITANNQTKVYGAALPSLTASYSGFVNGDTQASLTTQPTLSTLATAASTVAGSPYAITASGAASSNYTINYVAGTLAVTAAPLTITANNQTKVYGAALPSLTASYSGFVNGDTQASLTTQPTLSTLATAASTVAGSPYAITASGAASSNYTINYVAGTLAVTAAPLTITANNQTKAYGAALPSLSVTYSGFVNGDTQASLTTQPTLNTLATAASTVAGSPYAITASGAASSNYTINYVAGTLTVTAAPLTITANNQTKVYGAALPSLTANYSGFVNGDTQASLTTQPTLSTLATAASWVDGSPYAITASGAASSNYTINYVAGTLAVTPAPLTITANNQTKAYGAALPSLTFTYSGFVSGDTPDTLIITQPTLNTLATAASTVAGSPYAITASGAVSSNSNYTISYVAGSLAVTSAPLTITANNQTKAYGAALPSLTASYSGFVNGDTEASLTTQPTLSTLATAASTVAGSPYAITASGAASSNYTINYVAGTLAVTAAPLTITANNQTKAYGAALPSLTASYSGFVNGDTQASLTTQPTLSTLATAASTVAGSPYAITASGAASSNYTINYVAGTLAVTAAPLTITANNQTKAYGAALPSLTASYSGFVNGDTEASLTTQPTLSTVATAASTVVGSPYAVTASGAASSNYTINYVAGTLAVTAAPLTITANNQTKAYGAALPSLTASYSGFVNGDTEASLTTQPTLSTLATAASTVAGSPYAITASGAASSNYTINYVAGTLAVNAAPLTITANNQTKTYGDAVVFAGTEFTSTGLTNGDAITSVALNSTGSSATATVAGSTYPIVATAATGTGLGNYAISYVNGAMTITPRALVVASTNRSKVYGDILLNADFTGSITGIQNGDNITVTRNSTGALATAAIGATYPIVATLSDPDSNLGNYTVTNANGTLTVTQKALIITASARTKTYGDAVVFAGTEFTSTGLTNGDAITSVALNSTGSSATATVAGSTYPIVASAAVGTGLGNYAISYVNGAMTVTPRALVVASTNRSKVYGDILLNADFTGSITGIQNGDNITVTRNSTGALATAAIGATYPIVATLSDPDSNLGNYTVTNTNGSLTVTQKALIITASARTKTYGDAVVFAGTEFTSTGLTNGDAITSVALNSTGSSATATVAGSTYPIVASAALGTGLGNYAISYVGNVLTVNRKGLIITADNKEKFAGTVNPPLTVSYTGLVNGETSSVFTIPVSISTTAITSSSIGDYPIKASGAAAANYTIAYIDGMLKVKPGAPTSINLANVTLLENKPVGTTSGTLSSTSDDPAATFTYSLVAGTGDTDNALFAISGTLVNTSAILDYETKAIYSIRVRSTTQYGFSLDRVLTINLTDVNESPTIDAITNQTICYTRTLQNVALSGISSGPESAQSTMISVTTNNSDLFQILSVAKNGALGTLSYSARAGASGTAIVTVTVRDNGGTANGGVDVVMRTFNITINPLPNLVITSDKGASVSKGETIKLTASGGNTYVWSNAAGIISGQNTAVLTVRPSVNTTYTVVATSAAGCSQSSSFTIDVASDFAKLNISNLLTPNGDGFNDKWIVENIDLYPNNTVRVFDKSGRTVYEKKGYDNSWEGTHRGVPLAEDTYYYVVDFGPGFVVLKGFITILSSK